MSRRRGKYRRAVMVLVIAVVVPCAFWFGAAAWQVWRFQPAPVENAAMLFDAKGRLVTTLGARRQPFLEYAGIPPVVRTAVVDIEDVRFWQHPGVDLRGIIRSLWVDLRTGSRVQGASTLTQQIAKLQFLTPRKTILRKVQEAGYALLLEARFTKEQILAIYLNTIYFGEGAYGLEDAALTYFGKSAAELELAEAALLVGLPKAPSALSPYSNPSGALDRRQLVLDRMAELGHITAAEARQAAAAPLQLVRRRGGLAPYFADYVSSQLTERFGEALVRNGGLRVYTTLDLDAQAAARDALGNLQGGIVAIDPRNGAIRAMVGGRDYIESQFNRATQAFRQPGSAFKPFIYAAALESGWQMNTVLNDYPQNFHGYQPQNFKGEYWENVTMKQALAQSLNNASVWLLDQIGVNKALEMATRLGIKSLVLPDDRNLALALGGLTKGVSPLELAGGYLAFANKGVRYEPYSIDLVADRYGRTLLQHRARGQRVLSEEIAFLMTDMLQAVVDKGTGTAANIGRPVAGKTGTTNDARNAWFIGYTPQLLATVYVGNDRNTPLSGGGGSLAAPIWGKFAAQALADTPVESFRVPASLVANVPVDVFTGLRANDFCQLKEFDAFYPGQEPVQAAPCFFGAAQPRPYQLARESNLPGEDTGSSPSTGAPSLPEAAPASLPAVPVPVGLPPAVSLPELTNRTPEPEPEPEPAPEPQQGIARQNVSPPRQTLQVRENRPASRPPAESGTPAKRPGAAPAKAAPAKTPPPAANAAAPATPATGASPQNGAPAAGSTAAAPSAFADTTTSAPASDSTADDPAPDTEGITPPEG